MLKVQVTTSSFGKAGSKPIDFLEQYNVDLRTNSYGQTLTEEEAIEVISDADGLIAGTEPLTKRVINSLPNLKVISRCGTGMDSVDMEAAREQNIVVRNTPDVHIKSVAELALTGILSCFRNVAKGDRVVRSGKWGKIMGKSLYNKTVGIIGFGKVGRELFSLLQPFDVSVIVFDPYLEESDISEINIKKVALDELLGKSDVISLHAPYNEETHHLINKESLSQVKPNITIVNTARGGVADEEALFSFLKEHDDASAFLDVFSKEPYTGSLAELENVTLSPHVASRTKQTREEMEFQAAKNLMESIQDYE